MHVIYEKIPSELFEGHVPVGSKDSTINGHILEDKRLQLPQPTVTFQVQVWMAGTVFPCKRQRREKKSACGSRWSGRAVRQGLKATKNAAGSRTAAGAARLRLRSL